MKFITISIFSLLKIETAKFLKLTTLISFAMPKIVINIYILVICSQIV